MAVGAKQIFLPHLDPDPLGTLAAARQLSQTHASAFGMGRNVSEYTRKAG